MNIVKLYFKLDMDWMLINIFMTQYEVKAYKVKCVTPTIKMEKVKRKRNQYYEQLVFIWIFIFFVIILNYKFDILKIIWYIVLMI